MTDVLFHIPSMVKEAKIRGSQIFQKYSFLNFPRPASPRFSRTRVKGQVWWRTTVKPQTLEPDVLGKRWKKAILTDGGAKR
jgi:hypothetical protein